MADPQPPGVPLMGAQNSDPPESLFDDRYHIVRTLGAGGFGRVYLAVDHRLGRDVAIKELLTDRQQDRETYDRYLERFQREARAGSALRSENIVTVYDLHVDNEGNYYLVLEYVEGQDLSDLLAQVGVLPLERALAITLDIARALDAVHELDIVHRDIKPANILITVRGLAKLSDFGLAQVANESHRTQVVSHHPGTPVYMSPEQRIGFGYIDGRSDLFSLGLVLYEMLTGRRFGETGEPFARARPDLPPAVTAVIEKLLQADPNDRYQSAHVLIDDLTRIATQPDIPIAALPGFQAPPVPPALAPSGPHGIPPRIGGMPPLAHPGPAAVAPPFLVPPLDPPRPARRGRGGIVLVIIGAIAVLLLAASFIIVGSKARQRSTPVTSAPIATSAPALLPAAPTVTPPLATKAAPIAATAASVASTSVPGSDPRASVAPASPTNPALHITPTDTNAPGSDQSGATAAWDDDSKVLRINYPRSWLANSDQTTPGKILQGPDGTTLFLSVRDPAPGTLADEIQQQRSDFDESTELLFTYAESIDIRISSEAGKTFSFVYTRKDQLRSANQFGQVWIVNHGGREYVFTALSIGQNRRELDAIIASVVFLR